jgi:hypothetical protein
MPQLPNLRAKLTGWYTYHQLCYCLEDEKQHRHIYPLALVMLVGQRKHQENPVQIGALWMPALSPTQDEQELNLKTRVVHNTLGWETLQVTSESSTHQIAVQCVEFAVQHRCNKWISTFSFV